MDILAAVDAELARLQQVRTLLAGETHRAKPGPKPKTVRTMSAAGRAAIAAAQRERWAKKKKAPK